MFIRVLALTLKVQCYSADWQQGEQQSKESEDEKGEKAGNPNVPISTAGNINSQNMRVRNWNSTASDGAANM